MKNTVSKLLNDDWSYKIKFTFPPCAEVTLYDENDKVLGVVITRRKNLLTRLGIITTLEAIVELNN